MPNVQNRDLRPQFGSRRVLNNTNTPRRLRENQSINQLRFLFFSLFVVDVLFLPFPSFIPTNYSTLAIPVWLLFEARNLRIHRTIFNVCIALLFILASFFYAYLNKQPDSYTLQNNAINTGIVIYMMLAYIALSSSVVKKERIVINVLKAYLLFCFLLAAAFLINPSLYFSIRSFWTLSNTLIEVDGLTRTVRFTGILSDPNNMAIIAGSTLSFIIFRDSRAIFHNSIFILMVGVIVASTMSVTGLICFAAVTTAYFGTVSFSRSKSLAIVLRAFTIISICAITYIIFLVVRDSLIVQLALERASRSSVDSRFSRWEIALDIEKMVRVFLIGDGGTVTWKGNIHRPHNGVLHLYLNYGIISCAIFLTIFFKIIKPLEWKRCFFLLPIFIGFFVNVGIYEPRFAGIWVLLAASYQFADPRQANLSRKSLFKSYR